jgi:hypothetical protein
MPVMLVSATKKSSVDVPQSPNATPVDKYLRLETSIREVLKRYVTCEVLDDAGAAYKFMLDDIKVPEKLTPFYTSEPLRGSVEVSMRQSADGEPEISFTVRTINVCRCPSDNQILR